MTFIRRVGSRAPLASIIAVVLALAPAALGVSALVWLPKQLVSSSAKSNWKTATWLWSVLLYKRSSKLAWWTKRL